MVLAPLNRTQGFLPGVNEQVAFEERDRGCYFSCGCCMIPGPWFLRLLVVVLYARCLQPKCREDLDYDDNWINLPNMFNDHTKSRYYVEAGGRHVNGDITVAYWYTEPDETLFYDTRNNGTTAEGLQCVNDVSPNSTGVYRWGVLWGSATECHKGPQRTSDLLVQYKDKCVTPQTITMKRFDEGVFVIVEERSSFPSFLYWSDGKTAIPPSCGRNSTLQPPCALRKRLTGLVQGETPGGGCFGLLRTYSEYREPYDDDNEFERALPFGERPSRDSNANIQDKESIHVGLTIEAIRLLCLVCTVVLTSIGVAWAMYLHSGIGMDVYDRDELSRAASFSGAAICSTPPSAIRIFVRKEDEGNIGVVISDAIDTRRSLKALSNGLLALVTLASLAQELSMDLENDQGDVDLFNRPPPVTLKRKNGLQF